MLGQAYLLCWRYKIFCRFKPKVSIFMPGECLKHDVFLHFMFLLGKLMKRLLVEFCIKNFFPYGKKITISTTAFL